MNLKNATALITGGSSGIGLAIAKTLAEAGSRVAITGRDEAPVERGGEGRFGAIRSRPTSAARKTSSAPTASSSTSSATSTSWSTTPAFGVRRALVDMDLRDSSSAIFRTNVTGTMLMSREAAKHFIERKRGNIVNIASTAACAARPTARPTTASKFALRGMTECWRAELRQHNVRVIPRSIRAKCSRTSPPTPASRRTTTTRRSCSREDIAHVVKAALEMNDRGFTTELTVFATNPERLAFVDLDSRSTHARGVCGGAAGARARESSVRCAAGRRQRGDPRGGGEQPDDRRQFWRTRR